MMMKYLGVVILLLGEIRANLSYEHPIKLFNVPRIIIAIITCIAFCRDMLANSKHSGIDNDKVECSEHHDT
mgnify:CR=1 FL=1